MLNPTIKTRFISAFENKCYFLLIYAYNRSLEAKEIQLDWNENDISEELVRLFNDCPDGKYWNISADREYHLPIDLPKVKGFADKLPRIDVRCTKWSGPTQFMYYFEAKNLRQSSSKLKRRYIDTGIDNFICGRYPQGSLVGYILEGDIEKTVSGINRLLIGDKRSSEILNSSKRIRTKTHFESVHSSDLILKHLMLDFTTLAPLN